jgi:hypothetical protein
MLKGALSVFMTLSVYINLKDCISLIGIERGIIVNNAPFKGTDLD